MNIKHAIAKLYQRETIALAPPFKTKFKLRKKRGCKKRYEVWAKIANTPWMKEFENIKDFESMYTSNNTTFDFELITDNEKLPDD